MPQCKGCHKEVEPLDLFPKGLCMACHEQRYNELKTTTDQKLNEFVATWKTGKGIVK